MCGGCCVAASMGSMGSAGSRLSAAAMGYGALLHHTRERIELLDCRHGLCLDHCIDAMRMLS